MPRRFQFSLKDLFRLTLLASLATAAVASVGIEWFFDADWGEIVGGALILTTLCWVSWRATE